MSEQELKNKIARIKSIVEYHNGLKSCKECDYREECLDSCVEIMTKNILDTIGDPEIMEQTFKQVKDLLEVNDRLYRENLRLEMRNNELVVENMQLKAAGRWLTTTTR